MTQNNSDGVTKRKFSLLDKHKLLNVGIFGESQCQSQIWTFVNYEIRAILKYSVTFSRTNEPYATNLWPVILI
jgi:hypothetical protein